MATRARILADYVSGGATAAEFDYLDGVTSNIQTQFTAKAPLASPAFTGTPTGITAAHITSGVLPVGVTGGSGLTAVNAANIASGVLPVGVTGGSGLSLVNRPCFLVTGDGSTATTMAVGVATLINFPTVAYDPNSYYVSGTDRWLPTNGSSKYYWIFAFGGAATGNDYDRHIVEIRKNNVTVCRTAGVNQETNLYNTGTIVLLDGVDDYIDVYMTQSATNPKINVTSAHESSFGAFAISG